MKSYLVVVSSLCAYVQTTVPEVEDSITSHIDFQELRLKARPQDISEDDQRLSSQLSELDVPGRSVFAKRIQALLASFRPVIINGKDALPPLDPLYVPHIGPFTLSSNGVVITVNLYNFNMEGLQWYVVEEVTFSSLRRALGVQMSLPLALIVTGSYDAFAHIAGPRGNGSLLLHNAGGNFRVFVSRIETSVDVIFGTNLLGGGHLILRELDIKCVIDDVTMRTEGMVGSNVLNSLIKSLLQNVKTLVREKLEGITQALSQQLFEIINDFLRNLKLHDLLGK